MLRSHARAGVVLAHADPHSNRMTAQEHLLCVVLLFCCRALPRAGPGFRAVSSRRTSR